MARKVTITLTDDLDDSLAADETVSFGLDGVEYEIDLNSKNADKLRKVLAPYAEHGRRSGGRKQRARLASLSSGPRTAIDREQSRAIRDWAKGAGIQVSERGRISQEVINAFNAAN
ncbi:histone-like nucleoid-structuring protein Lsr2 [Tsukamurella tyrosinosolvens]|uniref:histone-like nucleoid-structuring protein Lsr2 n=1 Tax=Tsukamurella tyrosinosolvens TaxID=57704 RepID=UPI00079C2AE6|nr:Lsr2 family protein [Tsukamurella tyrosinosolvens]KXP08412.1 nucleoid-associated protein Lsr2 [Tsukamurella tyrosinosolvens]